MSTVEQYYYAHSRVFSLGRVSPVGLSGGGIGFAAGGVAMTSVLPAHVSDVLLGVCVLGMVLFGLDVGVARLVGSPPSDAARAARGLGQSQTFTTDRQVVVSSVVGGVGMGLVGVGLMTSRRVPGPPGLAVAFTAVAAIWGAVLVFSSRHMTVTIDDSGVRDDSFPFRHRFASWDRVVSASVFATTPASAQVVLKLRDAPSPTGSPEGAQPRKRRLRIPCQYLTVTAGELLHAITSDPKFEAAHASSQPSGQPQ